MDGVLVLNSKLPENIKAATIIKNDKDYCIILNDIYDEKMRNKFLKEELKKIKILVNNE